MTIITKVEFSEEEIEAMVKTLNYLSELIDDPSVSHTQSDTASNAFEGLARILCLDPMGELAFHREGW